MSEHPTDRPRPDRRASTAARTAAMACGIGIFAVGVVVTLIMPDAIALGITLLGVGVVLFSLAGSRQRPPRG